MIKGWYGHSDYRFIKIRTDKNGDTVVIHKNKVLNFGKGAIGLRKALQYVDVQRFLYRVAGRAIGVSSKTTHPVLSLAVRGVVKKVIYTVEDVAV